VEAARRTGRTRRHLRLIWGGGGGAGRSAQIVALCALWLAIVWLLFASLIGGGKDGDRPGSTSPISTQRLPDGTRAPAGVPQADTQRTYGVTTTPR
jgi:hypothetical protein